MQLFDKEEDYELFEKTLIDAKEKKEMRILSYCIMPNHFHFVLQPLHDGDLSKFMSWFTMTHTQRWHAKKKTVGTGHVYQGRYKSFIVQSDAYFYQLMKYVEQNPLKAGLVKRAQDWHWGSLWKREKGAEKEKSLLAPWPMDLPDDYLEQVNTLLSEKIYGIMVELWGHIT